MITPDVLRSIKESSSLARAFPPGMYIHVEDGGWSRTIEGADDDDTNFYKIDEVDTADAATCGVLLWIVQQFYTSAYLTFSDDLWTATGLHGDEWLTLGTGSTYGSALASVLEKIESRTR